MTDIDANGLRIVKNLLRKNESKNFSEYDGRQDMVFAQYLENK